MKQFDDVVFKVNKRKYEVDDTIEHYEGDPFFGFFTKPLPARKKKM